MDHDATLRVIERIYETATTNADWSGLLNEIADLARADNAWLVMALPEFGSNTVIAPRSDPDIICRYQEHWWQKDVTLQATLTAPAGRITSLGEIGRERFLSSEFYNEFWCRSGQAADRIVSNLIVGRNALACIGLQPSARRDEIDTDTATTFAVLVPHLIQSVRISCKLRELELEREIARSTPHTGAVLVDANMRILVANEEAEVALEENMSMRCERGRFALRDARDNVRLHDLVKSCGEASPGKIKGGSMFCSCDPDQIGLRIDVLPFSERQSTVGPWLTEYARPVAILALVDAERNRREFRQRLREKFGLTPAEAAIALELMRGESRADVARRTGVTLATVRTHMMHIFEKAGVHNRSALIGRMMQAGIDQRSIEP